MDFPGLAGNAKDKKARSCRLFFWLFLGIWLYIKEESKVGFLKVINTFNTVFNMVQSIENTGKFAKKEFSANPANGVLAFRNI